MVKNKRMNQKKQSKKSANNESEIAAPSTSNYRSTGDIGTAVQCSLTPELDLIDEDTKGLVDEIIECKKSLNFREMSLYEMALLRNKDISLSDTFVNANYICISENKSTLEMLLRSLNQRLADRDPDFVNFVVEYINKQPDFSYLQEQVSSATEMVTLAGAGADYANAQITMVTAEIEYGPNKASLNLKTVERKLKEQGNANAEFTMATAKLEYGQNEASLDLETEEMKPKEQGDANAQVTLETSELEYGRNELNLDLGTEKRKEKMGFYDISVDDIQKPACTPHNVESKNEGKNDKGRNRCTDDIQLKGDSPQNVTGEMERKKSTNRSPDDNPVVDQCSQNMDLGCDDEMICRALGKIMIATDKTLHESTHSENIEKPLSPRERKSRLDSIAKRHRGSNAFSMSQNPNLAKDDEKYMNIQPELTHLERLRNLPRSSAEEAGTTAKKAEIQEETKDSNEQADDANEQGTTTAAELENEPKELEKVEKKDATESDVRYIVDSEKAAHSPHHFPCQKQGKQNNDSNRSADSIQSTLQSSHSREIDHDDKTLTKTIAKNEEKEKDIPVFEHSNNREKAQNKPETLDGIQHSLEEVLKPEHSKLDKYAKTLRCAETALNSLKQKQAADTSTDETDVHRRLAIEAASVDELIKQLEKSEIENIVGENLTGDFPNASHSPKNVSGIKKDTKDSNSSKMDSGDTQTAGHSPKNVPGRKKDTKDSNKSKMDSGDTQTAGQSPKNVPERKKDTKDSNRSKINSEHSKLDECTKTLRYAETTLNILKQTQDAYASKNETAIRKLSIEAASVANELNKQLEKDQIEKIIKKDFENLPHDFQKASHSPENASDRKKDTKDINKSKMDSGDTQTAGHSPKNVTEGRNEGNKFTKYIIKSTSDLQVDEYPDFDIDKTMTYLETIYPKNMAQKISPQKTEKKAKFDEKFRRDLKGFFKLQNSKLDEQMEESGVVKSDLEPFKEQRDKLPAEKKSVTSTTEAQFETVITPEAKDNAIEDSATFDPNEVIVRLDKNQDINFSIDRNGFKTFNLSSEDGDYAYAKRYNVTYDFKHEKVQVSFIGDQILVRTQNTEFDIFVRKPEPVDLKDDVTQTDDKP